MAAEPRFPEPRQAAPAAQAAALPEPDITAALLHGIMLSDDAIVVVDATDPTTVRVMWANVTAAELVGTDPASLSGMRARDVLSAETLEAAATPGQDAVHAMLRRERSATHEGTIVAADGHSVAVTITTTPVPGTSLWTARLTPRADGTSAVDHAALAYERRFSALTERTPVPTVLSDVGLRLAHVNDAFCDLIGAQAESLLGTGWIAYVHDDDLEAVLACAQQALEGENAEIPARIITTAGDIRWVQVRLAPTFTPGHGPGFVGTVEDVTERRAFEQRLSYQARHDPLTGLPNRTLLVEHVADWLRSHRRDDPPLSCLFLDLDNFKLVNDSLGHNSGDTLLIEIARRVQSVLRDGDVVARFGGDEFVVVCHGLESDARAVEVAERVLGAITVEIVVRGVPVVPSASVGVARFQPGHLTPEDLLRDADIAMYQAKGAGRNRVALSDLASREKARDALRLVADLRDAITQGTLSVAYQPVVSMADPTGPLPAVEALARWAHPVRGAISPEVFVDLAEQHALINELGLYVLDVACRQMRHWIDDIGRAAPGKVNVNLSAPQLADLTLVANVRATLARYRLDGTRLCLEITESALMADPEACRETLLELRALGVTLAIDDFGTGYSSLAYLRQLPVDYLKIDRSFVAELTAGHSQVVQGVVSLAHSLGLFTVAEGVEEPEQVPLLTALGCELAQGFLFARPMDGLQLAGWREATSRTGETP